MMPLSRTAAKDKAVTAFDHQSMRILLDTLSHTPVGVVEHVGSVLALCASVVEAGLPASRASAFPSRTVGGVATTKGSLAITDEGRKRATAIVDHARQLRRLHLRAKKTERDIARSGANKRRMLAARRARTVGAMGEEAVMALGDLRKWVIVRRRNLPFLVQILQGTEALRLPDALLVLHFARMIGAQEAREVTGCLNLRGSQEVQFAAPEITCIASSVPNKHPGSRDATVRGTGRLGTKTLTPCPTRKPWFVPVFLFRGCPRK